MPAPDDDAMRRDWDARARHAMRLYVATWYAHSDATWAEGTRRDAACVLERVPARLGRGHAALDLGCGAGRLLPALVSRFDRVTGVDVSPEMLAQARDVVASEPRITLRLIDGRSLAGLADAAFHFVLANAVFIHCRLDVITLLLGEVRRVLAPGGVLAATFNSSEPPPEAPTHVRVQAQRAAGARPAPEPADPAGAALPPPSVTAADLALIGGPTWDGHRFTRAELLAVLEAARLKPLEMGAMDTAWAVVAERDSAGA
jgi:SAM-dependent methyltransferase